MRKDFYFKVKFGFGLMDFVSVGEDEIEKAIYAHMLAKPVKLGNSYINGRNIISLTEDYHRYTGWHRNYEPTEPEDFDQIERDCPNFDGVLDAYTDRVRFLLSTGRENEIGKLGKINFEEKDKRRRVGGMKSIGELLGNNEDINNEKK